MRCDGLAPISGKYSDGGHVQELVAVPYKPCAPVVLFPRAIPRATRMPFSEGPKRKPVLIRNLFECEATGARPENSQREEDHEHIEDDKSA